jgi:hypothetical protein
MPDIERTGGGICSLVRCSASGFAQLHGKSRNRKVTYSTHMEVADFDWNEFPPLPEGRLGTKWGTRCYLGMNRIAEAA